MNLTCNSTLEHLRSMKRSLRSCADPFTNIITVSPGSEVILIHNLTFHDLARIIGAATAFIAVVLSVFLIFMHATHYTKPQEQKL